MARLDSRAASALPYSHIPAPVEAKLGDAYTLTHVITAGDMTDPRNVYDIQDGFYMPYGGFKNIRRPGPNYRIYRRIPASLAYRQASARRAAAAES